MYHSKCPVTFGLEHCASNFENAIVTSAYMDGEPYVFGQPKLQAAAIQYMRDRYSHKVVRMLLKGKRTQTNESTNAMIWRKLLKINNTGSFLHSLFGAALAGILKNEGSYGLVETMQKVGFDITPCQLDISHYLDNRLKTQREYTRTVEFKKRRKVNKRNKNKSTKKSTIHKGGAYEMA